MRKSILGISENIVGVLAYLFGWVSGIVALVMERDNKVVKFHALQSIIFFAAFDIVMFVVGIFEFIPILGGLVNGVMWLIYVLAKLYLMYTAYKGQTFRVPVIGDVCWEQANK